MGEHFSKKVLYERKNVFGKFMEGLSDMGKLMIRSCQAGGKASRMHFPEI